MNRNNDAKAAANSRKYTRADKERIIRMWNEGVTLAQIGSEYGCSKQAISIKLNEWLGPGRMRCNFRCDYPGVRQWLMDNRVHPHGLAGMMGYKYKSQIYTVLTADRDPRKSSIDKLLAATGLTYEQAFGKVESRRAPTVSLGDDFFGAVLNCAVRYCIGRTSYMPGLVTDFIIPLLPHLSKKTLWCFEQDVEGATDYGMDMDKETWMNFLNAVKKAKEGAS